MYKRQVIRAGDLENLEQVKQVDQIHQVEQVTQVEQVKQVKKVEHVVTSHEVSSEVEAKSLRDVTVPQLQLRVIGVKMLIVSLSFISQKHL